VTLADPTPPVPAADPQYPIPGPGPTGQLPPLSRAWSRVRHVPPKPVLASVVLILLTVNVLRHVAASPAWLIGCPLVAAGLVLLARRAGLGWHDLGFRLGRGVRFAIVEIGLVSAVYGLAVAVPATRVGFLDSRYHRTLGSALLLAFVAIPLGTVLLEEVAFRGLVWGLVHRHYGAGRATAVSGGLFGLWHVLPSLRVSSTNAAVAALVGAGLLGRALTVCATVAFTGVAGVVFAELRRRSRSLLAPVALHWATNGLGALVSAGVWFAAHR
jgi:CAAX protease family protein